MASGTILAAKTRVTFDNPAPGSGSSCTNLNVVFRGNLRSALVDPVQYPLSDRVNPVRTIPVANDGITHTASTGWAAPSTRMTVSNSGARALIADNIAYKREGSDAGALSPSPANIAFGSVAEGQSVSSSVIVTNTGRAVAAIRGGAASGAGFSLIGPGKFPITLAPGAAQTFRIQFAPAAAGPATGTLALRSDARLPLNIQLSGTGTIAQTKTLRPGEAGLNFGNVTEGQKAILPAIITNMGNASVTLTQATLTDSDFSVVNPPAFPVVMAPGANQALNVQFAPAAAGPVSGALTISSDAAGSPLNIALSGTGVAPVPITDSIFGSATPQTSDGGPDHSVELGVAFRPTAPGIVTGVRFYKSAANTGVHTGSLWSSTGALLARVTFTAETASGWQQANFASPVPVAAGATYVVSYHCPSGHYAFDQNFFSSRSFTNASGTLVALQDHDPIPNGSYVYGSSPAFPTSSYNSTNYYADLLFASGLGASPNSLSFGNVVAGNIAELSTKITNTSGQTVKISSATVSPGYVLVGTPFTGAVAAGASVQYTVQFAPSAGGSVSGTLTIVSNAPNSPFAVPLSGTGVPATKALSVSPASLSITAPAGQTGSGSVVLTNTGTAAATIIGVDVTGVGFSVMPLPTAFPIQLAPQTSQTITVQFSGAGAGPTPGNLEIASDAADAPLNVSLTGSVQQAGSSPVILFTDLDSGPNTGGENVSGYAGAYVTLYGNFFGSSQGSSTVTWNGLNCLRILPPTGAYTGWGMQHLWYQEIIVQLGPKCAAGTGAFQVTVNEGASNSMPFTVRTSGHIFFVAPDGNDGSGTGTIANPFATPQGAFSRTTAGDTLYLEGGINVTQGGTYATFDWTAQGTAGNPVAMIAYPGANPQPVIVQSGPSGSPYALRCDGGYSVPACTYGTVAGVAVRSTVAGLFLEAGTNWRVIANDISCPNGDGENGCFQTSQIDSAVFYGNYIHDNSTVTGNSSKQYHSVYFSTDSNHIDVAWNSWFNNKTCRALQFHSSPLDGGGANDPTGLQQFDLHVHDNVFNGDRCNAINFATIDPSKGPVEAYNNLILNVGTGPDSTDGGSTAYAAILMPNITNNPAHNVAGSGTAEVYNNTIYGSGNWSWIGITFGAFENDAEGNMTMDLRNNIVFSTASSTPYLASNNQGPITGSNNLWFGYSGGAPAQTSLNQIADPQFVNPSGNDFHLRPGSPAKGAGVPITGGNTYDNSVPWNGTAHDLDGVSRPSGPAIDLGAYETH